MGQKGGLADHLDVFFWQCDSADSDRANCRFFFFWIAAPGIFAVPKLGSERATWAWCWAPFSGDLFALVSKLPAGWFIEQGGGGISSCVRCPPGVVFTAVQRGGARRQRNSIRGARLMLGAGEAARACRRSPRRPSKTVCPQAIARFALRHFSTAIDGGLGPCHCRVGHRG